MRATPGERKEGAGVGGGGGSGGSKGGCVILSKCHDIVYTIETNES